MEAANHNITSHLQRCAWVGTNPAMIRYHDTEWGVPVHDERKLYEFMVLDAFQAGLSWQGVLNKRQGIEAAFLGFDCKKVAKFTVEDELRLMQDSAIIRNRQKIHAAIVNAQAVLRLHESGESLHELLWSFVDGEVVQHKFDHDRTIPTKTTTSEQMSKMLKSHGFRFVGPTICYAFMQAAGMVNDHTTDCFRHNQVAKEGSITS